MKSNLENCLRMLRTPIEGDVLTDVASRWMYATDASVYQQSPEAIVRPMHRQDCITVVREAAKHGVPLIPRAAGTSLAGQCIGAGIVVDISRYMTQVLEVAPDCSWVRVQPGAVLKDLNDQLRPLGVMFAPDPATADRCTIGGMIGNNAAGAHSILYGTTREHVMEIEAVLVDGNITHFGPLNREQLNTKKKQNGLEGEIYRTLIDMIDRYGSDILKQYPKPEIIRRNMGYALDVLLNSYQSGEKFNLASILCGSEGTLALITEAKLQLTPIIRGNAMVCAHFHTVNDALASVQAILDYGPAAIELLDKRIVELAMANPGQHRNCDWIRGMPEAVLVTEFHGVDDEQAGGKALALIDDLRRRGMGYHHPLITRVEMSGVWSVRKAGLGMLMGINSKRKPVAVIEDAAVAPGDLAAYARDVQQIMERHSVHCVYYGHASVGLLHLRPELDLADSKDRKNFISIAADVATLVRRYGGSLSGEHGDGRLRTPFLRQMLGEKVYELNRRVKSAFDPLGIFNPGIVISEIPIDRHLRASQSSSLHLETGFDWSESHGLMGALERCNGAGVCRRSAGRGVLCPSFQATREEKYSTRGRANLLRQMLATMPLRKVLDHPGLKDSLELCLGCKACKTECPSGVDIAKVKAEYLYQRHRHGCSSIREKISKQYPRYLRCASIAPGIANRLGQAPFFLNILGIHRPLPRIAEKSFVDWWRKNQPDPHNWDKSWRGKVYLLCDIQTQYTEPEIGIAAVNVLMAMGYEVIPVFMDASPSMLIGQGFLDDARTYLHHLGRELAAVMEDDRTFLVGLEPSELLVFRDEAGTLVHPAHRPTFIALKEKAELFEEFIARQIDNDPSIRKLFVDDGKSVAIHLHCHQRALSDPRVTKGLFDKLFVQSKSSVMNSGCCGMAGTFGYVHADMSKRVAQTSVANALSDVPEDAVLVTSGSSCRQQFSSIFKRAALHPAQVLADSLH